MLQWFLVEDGKVKWVQVKLFKVVWKLRKIPIITYCGKLISRILSSFRFHIEIETPHFLFGGRNFGNNDSLPKTMKISPLRDIGLSVRFAWQPGIIMMYIFVDRICYLFRTLSRNIANSENISSQYGNWKFYKPNLNLISVKVDFSAAIQLLFESQIQCRKAAELSSFSFLFFFEGMQYRCQDRQRGITSILTTP